MALWKFCMALWKFCMALWEFYSQFQHKVIHMLSTMSISPKGGFCEKEKEAVSEAFGCRSESRLEETCPGTPESGCLAGNDRI